MKKSKYFSIFLLILVAIFMLFGCGSRWSTDRYRNLSMLCIENDEELLLELYERRINREDYSEIVEYLKEKYSFSEIKYSIITIDNNRIDGNRMEYWFDENILFRNYVLIYFPPGVEHEEDLYDQYHSEKISDRFYFYTLYRNSF